MYLLDTVSIGLNYCLFLRMKKFLEHSYSNWKMHMNDAAETVLLLRELQPKSMEERF
jgi:hypothetical protein